MDIDTFLSANKSMVIAPAGFGKTYTIAECIASYRGEKRVLVLTHTHVGIASLKEKFRLKNIPSSTYQLETICGFALNLVKAYHLNKDEIPSLSDAGSLFHFAIEHATKILKALPIKKYLAIKYDHLIVDEYQDCTVGQHQMIMSLSTILHTHILGDPLQGIFDFGREHIVDFSEESFKLFNDNCQSLEIPWRWNNAGRIALGQDLLSIRSKLLSTNTLDLHDYHEIKVVIAPENDYAISRSLYKNEIYNALRDNSVLLIHPTSESVEPRKKFIQQFPQLKMIESIDDNIFYSSCISFDKLNGCSLIESIVNLMRTIGSKTKINVWFKNTGQLKSKRLVADQLIRSSLETIITDLKEKKSYTNIASLIEAIENIPDMKVYRKDFLHDICNALRDADRLGVSAAESIERNRNILRRKGRKIQGKVIGTTLLTKGLEFDTVVVLNAHRFNDKRHLYVALTRCCKQLIVISNNHILNPD